VSKVTVPRHIGNELSALPYNDRTHPMERGQVPNHPPRTNGIFIIQMALWINWSGAPARDICFRLDVSCQYLTASQLVLSAPAWNAKSRHHSRRSELEYMLFDRSIRPTLRRLVLVSALELTLTDDQAITRRC
jgi:hypothetical protein